MNKYGLIGYPLGHSFSKKYFTEKFAKEGIANSVYDLYELKTIDEFPALLQNEPELKGINVTIPYKEQVIKYLDCLDASAEKVGAINVIKITEEGEKIGYNSDYYGFRNSLIKFLNDNSISSIKALILGTGGASKAVKAALAELGIVYLIVSREAGRADLTYAGLNQSHLQQYSLIINTTPVGTYPKVDGCPEIPYQYLSASNLLYDLVYNPEVTLFMQKGIDAGAKVINGLPMLYLQAEKAWEIWQQS
jgi:shikimate dehydrogenase